jgi:hypothetical protein
MNLEQFQGVSRRITAHSLFENSGKAEILRQSLEHLEY